MRNWTLTFLMLTIVHFPLAWSQVSFAPTPTPVGFKKIVKPRPKTTATRPAAPRTGTPARPTVVRPATPPAVGQAPAASKPAPNQMTAPKAPAAPFVAKPVAPVIAKPTVATPVPAPVVAKPPPKQKVEELTLDIDTPTVPVPVAKPAIIVEKPYTQLAYGLMLWQENIKATRVTDSTEIVMQLQGVSVDYTFNYFFQTRPGWRHFYTFQAGFGTVRGQGTTLAIPDQLKGHTWNLGTFEPGVAYATSEVSEVGFALPLTYRKINWALQSESLLEMSKTTSFSAALALIYINHINKKWDLRVAINNELGWKATRWSAAGQFLY